MQQDRFCRSCGQELKPEDRFCAGCGRPVYATAHVPTHEADVPVPPPPQQARDSSVPPQAPQTQSSEAQVQSATTGPIWGMLGVFLLLGIVETVQGMASADPGQDLGFTPPCSTHLAHRWGLLCHCPQGWGHFSRGYLYLAVGGRCGCRSLPDPPRVVA